MSPLFWRTLLTFVVAFGSCAATDFSSPKAYRFVHLTILDVNGQAVAYRKVYLRGWSAPWGLRCWGPINDTRKADGWPYATDASGKVTVAIGDFSIRNEPSAGPGWGTYAFLVDAGPNDAGGVSTRFFVGAPPDPKDEWAPQWGKPIPIPPQGLDLTLPIQAGVTVNGHIVDEQHPERSLAGVGVYVGTDLDIGTRSGAGNSIFCQSATTDKNGYFIIRHLFPNLLWVGVGPALWMKTKVNGAWVEVDNLIKPDSPTATIELEMAARSHPVFRYTGRVTDSHGKPVFGAEATASFTTEPIHSHFHYDRAQGKTDANGNYSLTAGSPWVNLISANAPNDNACYVQTPLTSFFRSPGSYDLQLPPATALKSTAPAP